MAVVGSGPAGFYTAYRVMSKLPNAKVDMYETLPVPFGLVRYGVAPDHPEVKNCQDKFGDIALSPGFRFLGNVSIGQPGESTKRCTVELQTLLKHYDSVLLAYGASEDKKLCIPGESTLKGIYSARDFVGWYNGLPDASSLAPDLTSGDEAIIIGQGNVALDVARILLEHVDVLRKTDITEHALAELARSRIRRVHVVGRRGPMQAAFTIKEVRELMNLPDVRFHSADRSLIPSDLKSLPRASRRLMEVLVKGTPPTNSDASRTWHLDSCLSPTAFVANMNQPDKLSSIEFQSTRLTDPFDPQSQAIETGRHVLLKSNAAFRSVGYKSVALQGFAESGIQFDNRHGIVVNDGFGRLTRRITDRDSPGVVVEPIPGLYCAGWVKRGPTGVIASTMQDAFITGDVVVNDWLSGTEFLNSNDKNISNGWEAVAKDVGASAERAISWSQWCAIDSAERRRGSISGKEREKFTNTAEMLAVLG